MARAFDAPVEARHAFKPAVAVAVYLASDDGGAFVAGIARGVGVIDNHHVGLSVAPGVFFHALPHAGAIKNGDLESAIVVFVLTLRALLALGIELRLGVDVSVVVAVLLDAPGDATLEPGKAIGLAVEVAVLALAYGFALHVFDDHVGLAIGVVVLPAFAGMGAGDFGPGIGLAIAHAVPGFPDQGAVLAVAEPTVHPAIVIAILEGALGKTRRIVDHLVRPAVAVAVGSLFTDLLVVVKEEIDFGAGQSALGR